MKNLFLNIIMIFIPYIAQSQYIIRYSKPLPRINAHGQIKMTDGKTIAIENFSDTEGSIFFIVRHAEKDTTGGSNADLTAVGRGRAKALKKILKRLKINGVYSTNVPRTRHTAEPIAHSKHLPVELYDAKKQKELVATLIKKKGNFFIVGHSNTVPLLVNVLMGNEAEKEFSESDYSRLYIISTKKLGEAKVLLIRF